MTIKYNFSIDINEWADFSHYEIGINVTSIDTINKIPLEIRQHYQNESISSEKFEQWKKERSFDKRIALMPGKRWRCQYPRKYLADIDLDNNKTIDEFCRNSLEEVKQKMKNKQSIHNKQKCDKYFSSEFNVKYTDAFDNHCKCFIYEDTKTFSTSQHESWCCYLRMIISKGLIQN